MRARANSAGRTWGPTGATTSAAELEPTSDGANVTVSRGLMTTYFRNRRHAARWAYRVRARSIAISATGCSLKRTRNGFFVRLFYTTSPGNVLEEYQFGRLVKVTTSDGYWQRLTYRQFFYSTGEPGDLKIDRISDAFGRQLSFAYSNDNRYPIEGLLISVSDVDGLSLGFEYNFVFEASPSLPAGTYAINLIAVTQRDSSVRRYLYGEASSFPAYGPMRMAAMTGKQDELGMRVGTYRYDGSGLAISTESAGGVNKYQVSSNGYIDPLGTSHGAQVTLAAGLNRIAGWYQPAGAGCGPSYSSIGYDSYANVTSRADFKGNKACYTYDLTRNLETKRVEGVVDATLTAPLHSVLRRPVLASSAPSGIPTGA